MALMAQRTLQRYVEEAIKAAEYSARTHVESAVGSMTHRDFVGQEIVFDLSTKPWAVANKSLIEEVIAEHGPNFQKRVQFIKD